MTVNLWTDSAHAQRYLRNRAGFPRREDGYGALLEFLPNRVDRVLDLGCGDGEVVGRVLTERSSAEAVAADFSPVMLRRARERFADTPKVTVVKHDLDVSLPTEWGTFDLVVSAFAIHHVVDERKRALYGEVYGRLRPGGAFLNLEHVASPTPELHEAFLAAFNIAPEHDDPSNQLAPVETQLDWLRGLGFGQVDCHWKWRELALLAAVRPAETAHST
jgi:SAM-dependent methyltransferase